jgi:hypothetical protein
MAQEREVAIKKTIRRQQLREIMPLADSIIYEMEQCYGDIRSRAAGGRFEGEKQPRENKGTESYPRALSDCSIERNSSKRSTKAPIANSPVTLSSGEAPHARVFRSSPREYRKLRTALRRGGDLNLRNPSEFTHALRACA